MKNNHMYCLVVSLLLTLDLFVSACVPPHHTKNASDRETNEGKVTFELKSDPIWQVPSQGLQTEVQVILEITNLESTAMRFPVMDKFSVSLLSADGNELVMEGGQDVLIPGKPISDPVQPGNNFLIDLDGRLSWSTDNQLELVLKDGLGSTWQIGPLKPGGYMLNMTYENQPTANKTASEVWSGKAQIIPVSIQILN